MSVSFRKKYFGPPFAFLFPFYDCIVPYIYVARLIEKYNFCENFSAFVEFSDVLNFLRSFSVLRLATGDCVRTRQNAAIFALFVKFSLEVH